MDGATTPYPFADTPTGRSFAEQGYHVARGVFDTEEIRELEADFDRIVAQLLGSGENVNARWGGPEMERLGAQATTVVHTHNVQRYSARWLRALLAPRLLEQFTAILGPDVVLHHTKLFQKPSETGAPFPMHQDWSYFPTERDSMLAGIIHVSEATDEMGCLRVVPGSHRLGRVRGTSGQEESELLARYPLEEAVPLEAEPGDVVFFHYFTLHGSMPNRSNKVRKTVLVQVYAGDDQVEAGIPHPDERLVLAGWNHRATRSRADTLK
ncbi:MAG: phytanoyl-CoA dioxygenase family protein [Fimbriimonadales bacterium]|nr:phytanoyl-CoA dioxygenase family protein [Fimbriimonadales bacterium]